MATTLTAAHRTWRVRVFAATWLSYVGFYFCRKPFSAAKSAIGAQMGWDSVTLGNIWAAYLIAYSIGAFLASRVGTILGPRRNLLLGMGLSIVCTLGMGIAPSWQVMAGLVAVNGLAQATGWSGNVGTMANWFHKHERGRVMGVWTTNFTIGSLLSGITMAFVLGSAKPDAAPWQMCFYVGAFVLAVVWIQFYFFQRDAPEDVGLTPIDDPVTAEDESIAEDGPVRLSRAAWTNLLLIAGFYFCAKFIRYAVWSWSAYFLERTYGLKGNAANQYATIFDLCGIGGVYMTGWLSDRYFKSRRAGVALLFVIGMMVVTGLLVAFGDQSVGMFTALLGGVGFFLYGPDALLSGAGAMDIGSRKAAVFATGVIAGFGALGPIIQELVIARMYDARTYFAFDAERWTAWTHSLPQLHSWLTGPGVFTKIQGELGPVFVLLFGSATLAAVFCALLVVRNRRGGKGV
jgi:OPA family sugar phosphate sensor protein UhpC-like MFS transporter